MLKQPFFHAFDCLVPLVMFFLILSDLGPVFLVLFASLQPLLFSVRLVVSAPVLIVSRMINNYF